MKPNESAALAALPQVIRPRPLQLTELEAMMAADHPFVARLRQEPAQVRTLAAFVLARDPEARARFETPHALALRLWLLLG
ncbi:MAG: hypothetical protein IPK26_22545 [Planctomycetes bacterium]|nr:hypothetical protein [Planctomycetota bacterium]